MPQLRGAFALAFLFAGEDDLLIGARKGSPLAVGYGDGEMYLGSDAIALAPFTDTISYLEDGDWAVVTRKGVEIRDEKGAVVERATVKTTASAALVDKGNHKHFMAKEIHEQPEVVGHTLRALHRHDGRARAAAGRAAVRLARSSNELSISACGTAFYAGLVAKYWFERFARLLGRDRRRVRVPLPRGAAVAGRSRDLHLAVRRDRRHAGHAALRQGAEAARALRRQRADLDHRARKRRRHADAGRPRDRRRLDQGLHLPACRAGVPRDRRRPRPRRAVGGRRAQSGARADRGAAPHGGGARARAADRGAGARRSRNAATCSISAAAPLIRSRSKAR